MFENAHKPRNQCNENNARHAKTATSTSQIHGWLQLKTRPQLTTCHPHAARLSHETHIYRFNTKRNKIHTKLKQHCYTSTTIAAIRTSGPSTTLSTQQQHIGTTTIECYENAWDCMRWKVMRSIWKPTIIEAYKHVWKCIRWTMPKQL